LDTFTGEGIIGLSNQSLSTCSLLGTAITCVASQNVLNALLKDFSFTPSKSGTHSVVVVIDDLGYLSKDMNSPNNKTDAKQINIDGLYDISS